MQTPTMLFYKQTLTCQVHSSKHSFRCKQFCLQILGISITNSPTIFLKVISTIHDSIQPIKFFEVEALHLCWQRMFCVFLFYKTNFDGPSHGPPSTSRAQRGLTALFFRLFWKNAFTYCDSAHMALSEATGTRAGWAQGHRGAPWTHREP